MLKWQFYLELSLFLYTFAVEIRNSSEDNLKTIQVMENHRVCFIVDGKPLHIVNKDGSLKRCLTRKEIRKMSVSEYDEYQRLVEKYGICFEVETIYKSGKRRHSEIFNAVSVKDMWKIYYDCHNKDLIKKCWISELWRYSDY